MTDTTALLTIRHTPQDAPPNDEGIIIANRLVPLEELVCTLYSVHHESHERSKPAQVTELGEDGKLLVITIEPSEDAPPLEEGRVPCGTYTYHFEALSVGADLASFHADIVSLVASWIQEQPTFAASDQIRETAAAFAA